MGVPVPRLAQQGHPVAPEGERHDVLKLILAWIADRFAEAPKVDDSIDWEDGEEHDEPAGPAT